ncbi:2-amino-4-hydroxy-6-hydroxymethyldihydropteridine diphosphokinase [Rickettsiales bacterium]|nr:2-amino-4-hydroxy-6-hydroxymethyldihydropteridine diphosphokinase [Rickettsiales bacterium]
MIILGLGSNVGDRIKYLEQAIQMLSENVLTAIQISPIYESDALLPTNSPESWDKTFLNLAITGETHLSADSLLHYIKRIEHSMGRKNTGVWSPREIDIDILAYGNSVINESSLIIPHKGLIERPFALFPLADLAPNWRYPAPGEYEGKTAFEISGMILHSFNIKKTELELFATQEDEETGKEVA